MDCFHLLIDLLGLECFTSYPLLQKNSMLLIIVPAPKCWPDFFVFQRCLFHFVRGPVLSTADQLFIYPTWSLSFQIFGHYSPLLKKKKPIERKEIKQLWFLKCTVDSVVFFVIKNSSSNIKFLWKKSRVKAVFVLLIMHRMHGCQLQCELFYTRCAQSSFNVKSLTAESLDSS